MTPRMNHRFMSPWNYEKEKETIQSVEEERSSKRENNNYNDDYNNNNNNSNDNNNNNAELRLAKRFDRLNPKHSNST